MHLKPKLKFLKVNKPWVLKKHAFEKLITMTKLDLEITILSLSS